MDGWAWELPDELQQLRKLVADFMRHEVRPAEAELDTEAYELPSGVLADLRVKSRAAGLWCLATPEEFGGSGMTLLTQCVVAEQASQCRMGAYTPAAGTFGWDPPNVIWKGNRTQIEKYALPTVASGGKTFVAITEPSGGADPARSIATTAVLDGGEWVINGTKVFISAADSSDWGIVFARTSPGKGRQGISCFIVEPDAPGLTMTPIPVIRSWYPCELSFVDCRVSAENLLGEEGRGFDLAQEWLVHGRVPYAAATLGIATAALDIAVEHALNRQAFGVCSPTSKRSSG